LRIFPNLESCTQLVKKVAFKGVGGVSNDN